MAKKGTLPLRNSLIRKSFGSAFMNGGIGGGDGNGNGDGGNNGEQELADGITLLENSDCFKIEFEQENGIPFEDSNGIPNYYLVIAPYPECNFSYSTAGQLATNIGNEFQVCSSIDNSSSPMNNHPQAGETYCFQLFAWDADQGIQVPLETFELEVSEDFNFQPLTVLNGDSTITAFESSQTQFELEFNPAESNLDLDIGYTICISSTFNLTGDPADIIENAEVTVDIPLGTSLNSPVQTPANALNPETEYWINVIAFDEDGNTLVYGIISSIISAPVPGNDGNIVINNSNLLNGATFEFQTANDEGATREQLIYEIYFCEISGPVESKLSTLSEIDSNGTLLREISGRSDIIFQVHEETAFSSGTWYNINVIVKDPIGNRAIYEESIVETKSIGERTMAITSVTSNNVTFEWGSSGLEGPGIEYRAILSDENDVIISQEVTTDQIYSFDNLDPHENYKLDIEATNDAGESTYYIGTVFQTLRE